MDTHTTAKRSRVARGVRAAILRGEYADGDHLNQGRLAAEYGVNRQVVWFALAALKDEGYVSTDARKRYRANASYVTHQLQLTLNKLDRVEWLVRSLCSKATPRKRAFSITPVSAVHHDTWTIKARRDG